jgi:hypothetical protein
MRATNAMAIDFLAFGFRSIEARRLAILAVCVKPVHRFHAIFSPKNAKSPQDIQVPRAASPCRLRVERGVGLRSVCGMGRLLASVWS